MGLILSILVVYGIVNILVNGAILQGFKNFIMGKAATAKSKVAKSFFVQLHKLMNCVMCSAFWVGLIVGIFLGPLFGWHLIFNGFLHSGACWIINSLVQFLGNGYDPSRTVNVIVQEESKINIQVDKPWIK
mgnify:CR=1 FL=1